MTERTRKRASKRELRGWAWVAGGLAFLAPWAALGSSPKPDPLAAGDERPVTIVRSITRRIVIRDKPAPARVRYVVAPSSGAASSAGGAVAAGPSSGSSGSAGGSTNPPPATTTGGS
jgi:hypothetical protein